VRKLRLHPTLLQLTAAMIRSLHVLFAAALAVATIPAVTLHAQQQQPIRGFPRDALEAQAKREQALRAVPSADTLRNQMRILSEEPHEAGTDRSRHVAELILARFKSYGLDAKIEQYEALMPRPLSRTVELVAPTRFTAKLKEPCIPEDKDSCDANQLPTFNAYSADGDVTAQLVYVNYGIPADYKTLDSLGISVRGKIVIARYGASWRGIKPKVAAEHGAIACIIYSDPKDDGYFIDDVYPKGSMRNADGVQRGSTMDMPTYPGDPLSPGWASEPGARKLALSEVKTLEPIPVLPISYGDAQPLLAALTGPVAPESWRGALPITYHIGAGPATVHLALKFDWQTRPLYDVVARIPGTMSPDQLVVYGNHHDAWVNGANDPLSGQVALDETARAFGQLLKSGWKPARTLILIAWDGEEWGLLGSTEWAEKHEAELQAGGVMYLNSDTNNRGWIEPSGSHSLQTFLMQVARDITDPRTKRDVLSTYLDRKIAGRARVEGPSTSDVRPEEKPLPAADSVRKLLQGRDTTLVRRVASDSALMRHLVAALQRPDTAFAIAALGSGSDYSSFLDHVGLASANINYGGDSHDGFYHSIYDSFDAYRRFADTTFTYGVAEAQTTGTLLLRLVDAPVLPFEFTNVVRTYRTYADEIEKAAKKEAKTKNLDLSGVRAALDRMQQAAERYEMALAPLAGMPAAKVRGMWKQLVPANLALARAEQALTDPQGLDHREWYKHLIYAPGFYTGYGVKTMPGIREAVEDRPDVVVAQREAARNLEAVGSGEPGAGTRGAGGDRPAGARPS
jgi:N-acetylated-alpha-linked acidic dipeptidase